MISHEELLRRLTYDPITGFFAWKEVKSKKVNVGDRAGYKHHGYRYIELNDRTYVEQRLAWFYVTGEWPKGLIDHKNLNRSDNRWENLRDTSDSGNQHNTTVRLNNKLGALGVTERRGKYRARIGVDGIRYILGDFESPEEAADAYETARAYLIGNRTYTEDDKKKAIADRVERLKVRSQYKPKQPVSYIDRFHQSYLKDECTGCWNWTRRFDKVTGYGWFEAKEIGKHGMNAHRASWIIHNGPINNDHQVVRHKVCDNRKCVNPAHLLLGTQKQNMEDCVQAGRINRGEDRPQSKLTEDIVREARQLRQQGMGWMKLAKKYGVAQYCIISAVMGKTWAHVDEPIPTYVGKPGNPRK